MNIKEILLKVIYSCLEFSSIFTAPIISRMAQSGGGDKSLSLSQMFTLASSFLFTRSGY